MRPFVLLLLPALAFAAPVSPAAPAMVTKAFMREIAAGRVKPSDLVDPDTGVLHVIYTSSEREPPETRSARRLCGDKAARALATIFRSDLRPAIEADELFSCKNRPRPSCVAGLAGEWMTKTEYVFRSSADGKLVLDTIIKTNSVYNPEDEARVVARLRAKYLGGLCD